MFIVDPTRVRVSGPLTPFKDGFVAELQRQGYTPRSASHQMQPMAWLGREELDARDLTRCLWGLGAAPAP
jgi:hypothetical protein